MVLAEGTTNLMQRLARLPKAPHVNTLLRRKPVPSALSHNHHLHIRWCCIDRLRPPDFSGSSRVASGMPVILPQPTKAHQRAWQSLSERVGTVATIDLSAFTAN